MGGTFNPIHYGHLVTAEEALHQYELDKIIFIPSGKPPHKEEHDVAPAEDRYLMTVIATAANPLFFVLRYEIDKSTPSFTFETLKELETIYPKGTEIFFITGADAILDIFNWKYPQEIFSRSRFIAATRPDYSIDKLKKLGAFRVAKNKGQKKADISIMEIPALAISSSEIRKRIAEKKPVRYLLPDQVLNYINEMRVYGQGGK